jgi:hypothetical protein
MSRGASANAVLVSLTAFVACGQRGGMGRVEFEACAGSPTGAERFIVCTANAAFLDEASRILATGERRVPFLLIVDGGGCDPRWMWHADRDTPFFSDGGVDDCTGCPSFIEADKTYWIGKHFCPFTAKVVAVYR